MKKGSLRPRDEPETQTETEADTTHYSDDLDKTNQLHTTLRYKTKHLESVVRSFIQRFKC